MIHQKDIFGGWSSIVRPYPVSYTVRKISPTGFFTQLKIKVFTMKNRKQAVVAGGVAAGSAISTGASAAVSQNVTDALAAGLTDVGTVGGAAFLMVIAVAVWRYLKRSA
jgi:hypothetical protein